MKKSIAAAPIEPPLFPDGEPMLIAPIPTFADGGHYADLRWANETVPGGADDVMVERVVTGGVVWRDLALPNMQLMDCRIGADDFAGAQCHKPYLRRVVIAGARMIGATLTDGDLRDVVFDGANLTLARIWGCALASVRFSRCALRDASFERSDLRGVRFERCDLSGADLRGAKLKGADLRGCAIDGLRIELRDLVGAIIDEQQALSLVQQLGIIIRPLDLERDDAAR